MNEKWSKGLDEMQKMASEMKILHEYTEKNLKSLSVLLDCLHGREIKQLENNEREGDNFKKIYEHCDEVIQVCFFFREIFIVLWSFKTVK